LEIFGDDLNAFAAYIELAPASADSFVEMTANFTQFANDFNLYTLANDTISRAYRLLVYTGQDTSSMRYALYRKSANTSTALYFDTVTMPWGGTWGLRSRIVGSQVISEVYIGKSLYYTHTDASPPADLLTAGSGRRGIEGYRESNLIFPSFEQVRTGYVPPEPPVPGTRTPRAFAFIL
jgi:hypothetical protein